MEHRPLKRVLDEASPLSKQPKICPSEEPIPSTSNTFATTPSAIEIRAFGLEDRAEAIIARGNESWTLANLSKWRHDTFDNAANSANTLGSGRLNSKEYLRQRQRAYRHQCLASSRDQHKQPES
ncbi:hypothetical protein P3T76_005237 [Phytophthora citrophthora]|uniref:Uncharacterized protein n=1 Tax=Phytophthora citrophthora TaxID=4793 RepID=A0AAD9GST9_9STRA|nr:hypothetical protein P3T76_005237 [Phytophthora citrophthora]